MSRPEFEESDDQRWSDDGGRSGTGLPRDRRENRLNRDVPEPPNRDEVQPPDRDEVQPDDDVNPDAGMIEPPD